MTNTPLRILLVEDDEDHAELVQRSLEASRVSSTTRHVADGQAALDFLFPTDCNDGNGGFQTDVVLLDLRLPRVGGLEVLQRIRASESLAATPVVILSTSEAQADHARALQLDANGYLVKPSEFDAFAAQTRDLGEVLLNLVNIARRDAAAD